MNKTKWIFSYYTGSSKKSVKSKMICTGINLHKSLVFSAVLGSELSTNLSSGASRPTTLTLSHLKKLGPPMCFQALGGCLRPTLRLWDSETLRRAKLAVQTTWMCLYCLFWSSQTETHSGGLCSEEVMQWLASGTQATQSLKAHWKCQLLWWVRAIVVDLGALEDEFVSNSEPKTAEKTKLLW